MPEESPLGLESGVVRLAEYDPRWPRLYAAEADAITSVLRERGLSLHLEHTGSTAVVGLCAKPIIDILAGQRTGTDRAPLIAALQAAGYSHRGEQGIAGRDFFRRGNPRSYHVHLTTIGSDFWNAHLLFREYLRGHASRAEEYGRLKVELARRFPRDRESYIEAKTQFVQETLRLARDVPRVVAAVASLGV